VLAELVKQVLEADGTETTVREYASRELLMAATAVTIIPLLIVFFCAQKYFVEGIVTTGIKG